MAKTKRRKTASTRRAVHSARNNPPRGKGKGGNTGLLLAGAAALALALSQRGKAAPPAPAKAEVAPDSGIELAMRRRLVRAEHGESFAQIENT